MRSSTESARRSAALHRVPPEPAALRLLRERPIPSPVSRRVQRLRMKTGRLSFVDSWLEPLQAARREVLGDTALGPPRFLVRVDEFPYYSGFDQPQFGYAASERFHAVMAEARVPHLMSVVTQWTRDPLNPRGSGGRPLDERDRKLLERMRSDGVTFAQHGCSHRTRYARPRRHSELSGLGEEALVALLERGLENLAAVGIHPRILVPPFNRFDAGQWPVLSSRYSVVTGGPETVSQLGFHGGPKWLGEAVYLPCYEPLYDRAAAVQPAVEALIDAQVGTWIPVVLHSGWETTDDFNALRRLAQRIAPFAVSWDEFLAEVDASRQATVSQL